MAEKSKVKEEKPKACDTVKDEPEEMVERLRVRETRKDDKVKEARSRVTLEDDGSNSSTSKTEVKSTEDLMKSHLVPNPAIPLFQDESSCEDKLKMKDGKQKSKDNKAKKEEKVKIVGERVQMREEKVEVKQKDEKVKEDRPKISLEEEKPDETRKKSEKKTEDEEKVKLCLVASCYPFDTLLHGAEPFLKSCQLCGYSRISETL